MKIILQDKNYYVLRFDKGEEIFEGLLKFLKERAISACVFNGIGACLLVELAYYNPFIKEYRKKPFTEDLEIISLSGNAGLKDGELIMHAHGLFGRNDFSVIGGHVFKIIVSVTCELFITKYEGSLERKTNDEFNLNLLV